MYINNKIKNNKLNIKIQKKILKKSNQSDKQKRIILKLK